jgi:hypothetical protein
MLVKLVLTAIKNITRYYSKFGEGHVAVVRGNSASTPGPIAQISVAAQPIAAAAAAAILSPEAQWQRVSAIVEQSVQRAHGIGEQQSAARQQLDAAEYTLHRLIEELNEVMHLPVQLPLQADVAAPQQQQIFEQALAA